MAAYDPTLDSAQAQEFDQQCIALLFNQIFEMSYKWCRRHCCKVNATSDVPLNEDQRKRIDKICAISDVGNLCRTEATKTLLMSGLINVYITDEILKIYAISGFDNLAERMMFEAKALAQQNAQRAVPRSVQVSTLQRCQRACQYIQGHPNYQIHWYTLVHHRAQDLLENIIGSFQAQPSPGAFDELRSLMRVAHRLTDHLLACPQFDVEGCYPATALDPALMDAIDPRLPDLEDPFVDQTARIRLAVRPWVSCTNLMTGTQTLLQKASVVVAL